ncbi:unnamed protein product [Rotaria sp. Silwood2]|nr:unnamed protein product [Rotaria sp. Silwood2]CAF2919041.1 unnamed protein product [Rotaria sp. Silwood2]CAF3232225.1 unnamed protein product [Rotaria sp. Silwood2]CAF4190934.1 unnamed protein product [Rotaria sp. Silwood2]CAF4562809.1 unnamed protein product [Rotaria sp. Silwood2]
MKQSVILLLFINVLMPCVAFYASPIIRINGRSIDKFAPIKQAANILNVAEPANWANYMDPTSTSGSIGETNVGIETLASVMAGWSIPDQFRDKAVASVNLLVLAATEGSYTAQAFLFDTETGVSLSTLLVATKKLDSPSDPNSPVSVSYVTINSNAVVKQQYTYYTVQDCHTCPKCVWLSDCCCHDETRSSPRGLTPDELNILNQKMKFDQFSWFNQQSLNKAIKKRALIKYNSNNQILSLTEAIEKFLSSNIIKAEILTSYNNSILSALQSHIASLQLSSQSLKMTKVGSENLPIVLSTLTKDYGFEDINENEIFLEQLKTGRFSYENLFTTSTDVYSKTVIIKYVWLIGQTIDNSTYSINFIFVNITSQQLINTLLSNETNTDEPDYIIDDNKKLKVVRTSILSDRGEFLNEDLLTLITPWQLKTTKIALNILRFIAASALIPQRNRMLSYFKTEIISPGINRNNIYVSQSRNIAAKILALSKAVSAAAQAWKDVVSAFKSSSSTTITRIVRFGFTYFSEKSTVLKAIDIPADRATEFINAVIIDYNLPSKGSFMLGLTYSDDFAWDRIDYLYSPSNNGTYRSLTLFKNGDSLTNTASFFIVDVDANWQLAPDLLLIQTSKSYLGGLFQSNQQSIQEVPHVLTLDEAVKLQQFFMLVAMGNLASTIGANVTLPQLD